MIEFHSENDFILEDEAFAKAWIASAIVEEGKEIGELQYNFCTDEQLYKINLEFLNHDTYTDIISFDYSQGDLVSGDIYISTERVAANSEEFKTSFKSELRRVMIHGVLHYCGYKDKTVAEKAIMRAKEEYYISKYNTQQSSN